MAEGEVTLLEAKQQLRDFIESMESENKNRASWQLPDLCRRMALQLPNGQQRDSEYGQAMDRCCDAVD